MEDPSVRRLDSEEPVGAMIRRIIGDDAFDLDLPEREVDDPIDFTSPDYGEDDKRVESNGTASGSGLNPTKVCT